MMMDQEFSSPLKTGDFAERKALQGSVVEWAESVPDLVDGAAESFPAALATGDGSGDRLEDGPNRQQRRGNHL